MKAPLIFSFILLISCSEELSEPQLSLRTDYITYNPATGCAGQKVTVIFNNGYSNNCGRSKLQQFIGGVWLTVLEDVPVNGIVTYTFTPLLPGEYRFRAAWNRSGKDCTEDNIRPFEEDPLIVERNCCQDLFTVTAICESQNECPYGVEIHFSSTVDNWIAIIGELPAGYSFCGLYDENGAIITTLSGNTFEVSGDFYACQDITLFVYFRTTDLLPSFGNWMVKDMQEVLYRLQAEPCTVL